ncbi:MAG: DUF3466 family protein [Planctomycetes bacterium]|nr:DUF3466 family protein [Planctomycetota bacterium]
MSAACIDRVIVRPTGILTTVDPVALEIQLVTPTSPTHLVQPTEVVVQGNKILIDVYVDGGPIDTPGSLVETVDLGTLPAETYTYTITQHPTKDCSLQTVTGKFCVDEVGCKSEACRCPVPPNPSYVIIDLGTLGGNTSVALGINESGQVVGSADTPQGLRHAYLWEAAVMIDLGTLPPEPQSEAWDISEAGHVVGIATADGGIARGFMWQDGTMIDLGNLGAANTHAFGVNEFGQVVGFSWLPPSEPRAFLWEDGVMSDLGTLGGASSNAWDVNSVGQVVGSSTLSPGEQGGAFLWENGVMTNLGTLGGPTSWASGINELGQVVGQAERSEGGLVLHAFIWERNEMIDLGALGGYESSRAEAINNQGEVVGSGSNGTTDQPFLYHGDVGLRDLRDLLWVDVDWSALSPRAINDAGQIVGSGRHQGPRAFLMTPIDGDFDDDGDTDMADFASFQICLAGPGEPIGPGCETSDIDRDGDIDLDDFQAFGWAFTGP